MQDMPKIAIVYDWIDKWGGVERILLMLHEMFPEAEFFTSYYDPEKAAWANNLKIKTSFIQKLPTFIRRNRLASFPFYPFAFESFDFSGFDLVISVTSSFAKSIITKPGTLHLCYLLTPTRYLWVLQDDYFKNKAVKLLLSPYLANLREWDYLASQRPDHIISISQTVANRCRKYYRRDSEVVYPPFDKDYWLNIKYQISNIKTTNQISKILTKKKYYLVVSRLEPYKKVELVVQSINRLDNYGLVIVGEGSQLNKLKQMARENVIFFNKVTDEELGYLYSRAEALIMPQEEDFGYVSLEAQFFGCPVIAYKKGGAIETVVEGKTGIFFEEQNAESLSGALKRYGMVKYELKRNTQKFAQNNIERFNKKNFENRFLAYLSQMSKLKSQNHNSKLKI